ncbi:MAG: ATP-binding protein [Myxococcota bacterium]
MDAEARKSATWSDRLEAARTEIFVGRGPELARALALPEDPRVRLLHVHGAAGMGKSTFARELMRRFRETGRRVQFVDAQDVRGSLLAFDRAVGGEQPECDLLIIDSFEALGAIEGWLRECFLPNLPDDVRVVSLGRAPLSTDWTGDRGWRTLAAQIELLPLSGEESHRYLEGQSVDPALREQIVAAASGWPLALGLLAQSTAGLAELQDSHIAGVLTRLAGALVAEAPSRDHARALHAAALVHRLTEPLLARMLDRGDALDAFQWLADWAFASATPRGLRLHTVLVEALYGHLRTRAPETLEELRRRAVAWYAQQLREAHAHGSTDARILAGELIYDALYTVRDSPIVQSFGIGTIPPLYLDECAPADLRAIEAAAERHEGPGAATVLRRWSERPGTERVVYRNASQEPEAFALFFELTTADMDEARFDPVVRDMFAGIGSVAPLRPGERMLLCRHWWSLSHGQERPEGLGQLISLLSQRLAFTTGVAVGAAVHLDPDRWASRPDVTHPLVSRTALGGVELGVFVHDWRRESPSEWFHRFVRVLAGDRTASSEPVRNDGVLLLDRPEFDRAVRAALRCLAQPERLCEVALSRAPLVARLGMDPGSLEAAEALRQLMLAAIDTLGGPERHADILRRTYIEPADKQLVVADELGMAFSTYRRHLKTATDRLIERLWAWETRGVPAQYD